MVGREEEIIPSGWIAAAEEKAKVGVIEDDVFVSRSVQLRQCIGCDNLFEDWVGVERHITDKHEGKR